MALRKFNLGEDIELPKGGQRRVLAVTEYLPGKFFYHLSLYGELDRFGSMVTSDELETETKRLGHDKLLKNLTT